VSTLVWRVLAWNPVLRVWTVRSTHNTQTDAAEHAEALQHRRRLLRVRVVPATTRQLRVIPPINNASRLWRLSQAERMSQLADDKKRHKSPG